MAAEHERQMVFFPMGGHNHNGENSTPVELGPGSVSLYNLDDGLVAWIRGQTGETGDDLTEDGSGGMPVPDLLIQTPAVAAGGSYTGSVPWTGLTAVRFTRILMTVDTECTITFYHKATFTDEDREFRARNCANKFLWEAPWIHYDEDTSNSVHYRIDNTGNLSSSFQIHLKSATLSDNLYAGFVEGLVVNGVEMTGTINIINGQNTTVTADPSTGNIQINANVPSQVETVSLNKWALTPIKPTAVTSSVALTSNGGTPISYLQDGYTHDTARYINFGSGLQWIQIDTGVVRNWGAVQVILYFADRTHFGVRIDVSADGVAWTTIRASGDVWATGEGIWVQLLNGVMARYLRVYCNGTQLNTNNHIVKMIPYMISDKG